MAMFRLAGMGRRKGANGAHTTTVFRSFYANHEAAARWSREEERVGSVPEKGRVSWNGAWWQGADGREKS